jgi:hypothetical protein
MGSGVPAFVQVQLVDTLMCSSYVVFQVRYLWKSDSGEEMSKVHFSFL